MKKLILALVVAAFCVGEVSASGHHPGKPRKGEVAGHILGGLAGGLAAGLLGRPEPPPPPPPNW